MTLSYSQQAMLLSLRYGSYLFPKAIAKKALHFFATPQCIARPPSEMAWFESAKKFKFGTGIAAFEWGDPQGPVVILLHGWSGRGTQMGAFTAPLVEKGYRVIALDGPAHGDSSGEMTNPGEFADCLLQAQKEFGKLKAVIAHSFGGGSSILAVSRGQQAEKLVLIASPSHYDWVVASYLKRVGLSKQSQKEFLRLITDWSGISPKDLNVTSLGKNYSHPVLIVHDEGDKEVRFSEALNMHAAWPQSQLLKTQNLGHRRILKDPEVVRKVADFI